MPAPSTDPFPPLIVHSRGSIVQALIDRRNALGLTGEGLDDIAGWADRYGGKLEVPNRPQGRPSFHFDYGSEVLPTGAVRATQMADVWTESLGVRLVLVDAATAKAIGAVPAPPPEPRVRQATRGGDIAPRHAAARITQGRRSTMTIDAFATADRARMAALSFKVAVTDHPWVAERPALQERAAEIERQMQELADEIGEAA